MRESEAGTDAVSQLLSMLQLPEDFGHELRRLALRWRGLRRPTSGGQSFSGAEDTIDEALDEIAVSYGVDPAGFRPAARELIAVWRADTTQHGRDVTPTLQAQAQALVDTVRVQAPPGRYTDLGLLGRGGMGEVRRVRDEELNRVVAMKIIRRELMWHSQLVRRFLREAQATAQLQHAGIVPVYDLGRLGDERLFFTMREVVGRELGRVIFELQDCRVEGAFVDTPNGWSLRRVVDVVHKVCEAMSYAHARGVIHRDLKPDNVMVGGYGEVLIVDWGLARVLGSPNEGGDEVVRVAGGGAIALTQAGRVAGTPNYMPPEQATGDREAQGPASDVYALGAVLYEVLCGVPPYDGEDGAEVLARVRSGAMRPLPEAPEFPPALRQICLRALQREPAARYPHAGAMAAELSAWLEGAKRKEQALGLVRQAREKSASCARLRNRADAMRRAAREQLRDPDARGDGWSRMEQAEKLDEGARTLDIVVTELARAALAECPDLDQANALLADHYYRIHRSAEARGRGPLAERYRLLLASHDDGRYSRYLHGDGVLTLITEPAGAEVEILRDQRGVYQTMGLAPQVTPIRAMPLAMGSYLLVLRHPDRETVRYPVHIDREAHWDGVPPGASQPHPILLPVAGSVAEDEVYVPAGWSLVGDDRAPGAIPTDRVWVDAFVIGRQPVVHADYLCFVNHLLKQRREDEAAQRIPQADSRLGQASEQLYARTSHGLYCLHPKVLGQRADTPVTMLDWPSAFAFAAFWAVDRCKAYRLPHELEWEKAARGVDGRSFPWGERLDPALACNQVSQLAPHPAPVNAFARDISPYGVRGMAGNTRDWCRNAFAFDLALVCEGRIAIDPEGEVLRRAARGGTYQSALNACHTAARLGVPSSARGDHLGVRLVRSLRGA